jgi:hypothetical protein
MDLHHDPQLDVIISRRPSIYGNTLVIALLKLIAFLLIFVFGALGVYFSYCAGSDELRGDPMRLPDLAEMHHLLLAVTCFLLSFCMMIIVWFGRMLIRRNQFIMVVEEWYLERTKSETPENA